MHTDTGIRPVRRSRPRLLAVVAMASALLIGITGCSIDAASQASKVAGDGSATAGNAEVPSLAGSIEPIASLELPEQEEVELNAAQKLALQATSGHETAPRTRIHLAIASPQIDLARFGMTYKGGQKSCSSPLDKMTQAIWEVKAGSTGESCAEASSGADISQELTFKLPGTTALFWVYVKNPTSKLHKPELQCAIIDPATWKPVNATATAYTCDLRWMQQDDEINPMPRVRVTKKDTVVVTDPVRAQQLLEENCKKNQPECDYTSTRQRVVSPPSEEWTLLDTYTNCGPDQHEGAEHSWAQEKEFAGTYTVTFEGSFGYGNPAHDKMTAKIQAEYKHIWTVKTSYLAEVEQPVPYGMTNLFYMQLSYLELQGDFTITTKDHVYLIKDTTYKLPLADNWTDEDGNIVKMMDKHSFGATAACASISEGEDKDHGPKLKASVQRQLDRGVIPSADELLAAGATLDAGE